MLEKIVHLEFLGKLVETPVESVLAGYEELDVVDLGEIKLEQIEEFRLLVEDYDA